MAKNVSSEPGERQPFLSMVDDDTGFLPHPFSRLVSVTALRSFFTSIMMSSYRRSRHDSRNQNSEYALTRTSLERPIMREIKVEGV